MVERGLQPLGGRDRPPTLSRRASWGLGLDRQRLHRLQRKQDNTRVPCKTTSTTTRKQKKRHSAILVYLCAADVTGMVPGGGGLIRPPVRVRPSRHIVSGCQVGQSTAAFGAQWDPGLGVKLFVGVGVNRGEQSVGLRGWEGGGRGR